MAIRLADTARPNNHVDAEHLGTFPVAYAEDVWFEDGTRLSEKTFDGQSVQKEELPLASADELGNIYQYIGANGTYKHGCFYECIENSGAYSWNQLEVSPNTAVEYVEELPTAGNIKDLIYTTKDEITYVDTTFCIQGTTVNTTKQSLEDFFNAEPSIPYKWASPTESGYQEYGYIIPSAMFYLYKEADDRWVEVKFIAPRANNVGTDSLILFNNTETPCRKGVVNRVYYVGNYKTQTLTELKTGGNGKFNTDDFVIEDEEVSLSPTQRIFTGTQAEWNALTTDEKKTYGVVNITDDSSAEYIDYYSTTETKTNKVWIDGKPIYRKVLSGLNYSGSSDSSSPEWKAIGTLSDISQILNCVGLRPSNRGSVGTINSRMNGNNLELWSDISLSPVVTHLLIEYTKEG